MTVFFGQHEAVVDDRGRLALPRGFVPPLAGAAVLTKGHDRCLYLLPGAAFAGFAERLCRAGAVSRASRDYTRVLYGAAVDAAPDGKGRVTVPAGLRLYAGVGAARCVVVGANTHVEIWSPQAWGASEAAAEEAFNAPPTDA